MLKKNFGLWWTTLWFKRYQMNLFYVMFQTKSHEKAYYLYPGHQTIIDHACDLMSATSISFQISRIIQWKWDVICNYFISHFYIIMHQIWFCLSSCSCDENEYVEFIVRSCCGNFWCKQNQQDDLIFLYLHFYVKNCMNNCIMK